LTNIEKEIDIKKLDGYESRPFTSVAIWIKVVMVRNRSSRLSRLANVDLFIF
jgi:hypothetical protein